MVDSNDKRAPERLVMRQDIGEVLRAAAEDLFPVERLEKNERIIADRLRVLGAEEVSPAPRRRLMRVALVTGVIVGLFSVGASALLV